MPRSPLSRRNILQYGAGFLGAGSITAWFGKGVFAQTAPVGRSPLVQSELFTANAGEAAPTLTPDQALEKLMTGNQRFVEGKRQLPDQALSRLAEVAQSQAPFAAILSCADSRVVPEILFDQGIGSLFVVRVAGNLANIEDIASQEFAVGQLKTPLLVVLGHERCGAVQAAIDGGAYPGVISSLVFAIRPAIDASAGQPGDRLTNAVQENVRLQVKRLQNSALIADAVKAGKLKVVGAYYDLDTGTVQLLS
ncbi:MAG TPA: carbonic anhydrase [Trichocoleus sp.]